MRLIEADETIDIIDNEITMEDSIYNDGLCRAIQIIGEQPTAKAIPVEWIKEYANNLIKLENENYFAYEGFGDWGEGIISMLRDWEKENEREIDRH